MAISSQPLSGRALSRYKVLGNPGLASRYRSIKAACDSADKINLLALSIYGQIV
jgi:hypothetical protein